MASNYIVIGSKFKPFSYQEMLAPVQMADTEHKATEEASAEMAAKAGMWGQLANEQTDPQAYNMYQTFANDLAAQADELARQGLTPGSRKALNTMRERYSQEIIPIENAYNRRKEFIDEQRKAMAQDNSVMFDFNAGNASLDQFINNPNITYQTASGNTLRQQAGDMAKNLAREMRENPRTWRSILGNQYYETLMQKGYTSEEILAALAKDPNAAPVLNTIVDQVVGASNVNTWNDPETLERARQYAAQGLWNAIGDVQYQTLSNKAYDYAMQDYYARQREARARAAKEGEDSRQLVYRVVPRTSVNSKVKTSDLQSDMDFLRQVMADDGTFLNQTAVRYPKTGGVAFLPGAGMGAGANVGEVYQPNVERLKALTQKYGTTDIQRGIIPQLEREIASSVVRDFTYKPNITDSDLIAKVIQENASSHFSKTGSTGIYKYEEGKKKGELNAKEISKLLNSADANLDYDIEDGITINGTDSDGNIISGAIDIELIDDENRTLGNTMNEIREHLDNNEGSEAQAKIRALMQVLYNKFNTLAKKQSSTDSGI